jgi:hypothetical protein
MSSASSSRSPWLEKVWCTCTLKCGGQPPGQLITRREKDDHLREEIAARAPSRGRGLRGRPVRVPFSLRGGARGHSLGPAPPRGLASRGRTPFARAGTRIGRGTGRGLVSSADNLDPSRLRDERDSSGSIDLHETQPAQGGMSTDTDMRDEEDILVSLMS